MSLYEGKYIIGLTGNIAVGKSVVRQMLQHLGAYPIDADQLGHQAMSPGAPAYQPVIDMFGKFVVGPDGMINRQTLGSIAFAIPEAMTKLEQITHPVISQAIHMLVTRSKQRIIVVEAIKLLEGDLAKLCNTIWVVDATPENQLKRLIEKRKMTEAEARKRIAAQQPQSSKVARANVVIHNNGNVEETWKQVQNAWTVIRQNVRETGPLTTRAQVVEKVQPLRPTGQLQAIRHTQSVVATPIETNDTHVRRGMPGNAEAIAHFITKISGKEIQRMDVMLAFGQKSYLLAENKDNQITGLVGWQVENLITRIDEVYLEPNQNYENSVMSLMSAVEDASRELQSEVSFIALPANTAPEIIQACLTQGYHFVKLEEIKFPAWREVAQDILSRNGQTLIKQLRADRVLKPI